LEFWETNFFTTVGGHKRKMLCSDSTIILMVSGVPPFCDKLKADYLKSSDNISSSARDHFKQKSNERIH